MQPYETLIATATLSGLIKAGYYITVDFDRGYEASNARNINSTDQIPTALAAMNAADECWLMLSDAPHPDGEPYDAFVYFIWGNGNDGKDCLSDWTSTDRVNGAVESLDSDWADARMATILSGLSELIDAATVARNECNIRGDYAQPYVTRLSAVIAHYLK